VIIFGSVRFLLKKITKPIFFKKNPKPVQTDWFRVGLVFWTKPVQTGLARFFWFDSVFPVWVRFVFSVLGL